MKKILLRIFLVLLGIVLIGKISNWFLNYSDETNQILNTVMFSLLGIAYLYVGFDWNNKLIRIIFIISGIFPIVMNFMDKSNLVSIIGILCIVTPLLIARFLPEESEDKSADV